MIVIGSATISADQSKVTINSPGGFGAYRGVRLTNYTANILILSNIASESQGQSQEFLLPLQQMVYHTANVQAVPTVTVFGIEGSLQVAPSVLVEWSTTPLDDFQGTYPVTIGTPSATPYACVNLYTVPAGANTAVLSANPFRRSLTFINQTVPGADLPALTGIFWATTNLPVWSTSTAPIVPVQAGRSIDTTAALYFHVTGSATNGTMIEIIEESWGACSLYDFISNT